MKIQQFLWRIVAISFFTSICFAEEQFEIRFQELYKATPAIVDRLVKSFGNQLQTDYLFDYIGNLTTELPPWLAEITAERICDAIIVAGYDFEHDPNDVPDFHDISIQLRTSCNIREYPLHQLASIVDDPDFDVGKSVVIAASGWLTNANHPADALEGLAKAYNCRGDTNFLSIDVGPYIQTFFTWSVLNTKIIGQKLAVALVNLTKVVPLDNLHLMGHSLGAAIVGEAARNFTDLTGQRIPRVTGFDPAGPCFYYRDMYNPISTGEAGFVDIIHTNPGISAQSEAAGDADFFVGGEFLIQNGCLSNVCSHQRSWQYYVESVYPGNEYNFPSKRCDSLLHLQQGRCDAMEYAMGYAAPRHLFGQFILEVNGNEPYGKNATSIYTSPSSKCGKCVN